MVADWSVVMGLLYALEAHDKKHEFMPARTTLIENYPVTLGIHTGTFFQRAANIHVTKEKIKSKNFAEIDRPLKFPLSQEHSNYLNLLASVLKIQINIFFETTPDIFTLKQLFANCVSFTGSEELKSLSQNKIPDLSTQSINISFANETFSVLDPEMSNFVGFTEYKDLLAGSNKFK